MRKLWNRATLPVWSLSTVDEKGKGNMNICAYVTSVSLQPKMMLVAVYHHTKTLSNLKQNSRALLQLLTINQADVVRTLGRQSGRSIDKIARVAKKHPVAFLNDLPYMTDAAGYMELRITELMEVGGDHLLASAEVVSSKNLSEDNILTTDYLKDKNIIR